MLLSVLVPRRKLFWSFATLGSSDEGYGEVRFIARHGRISDVNWELRLARGRGCVTRSLCFHAFVGVSVVKKCFAQAVGSMEVGCVAFGHTRKQP